MIADELVRQLAISLSQAFQFETRYISFVVRELCLPISTIRLNA
jgi:hypothetical protein